MPDIVAIAREKLEYHRKQVSELEQFFRMYDLLVETAQEGAGVSDHVSAEIVPGNKMPDGAVDNGGKNGRLQVKARVRLGPRPDHIADMMERIIREVGHPMTRGEIVAAFERRDVEIPYEDKARYVGTIAWRNKGRFDNIEGRGYWLRGEPVPPPHSNVTANDVEI
jgi:hypothetical protein